MAHQEDREERGKQGCGWHDFDKAVCPRCRQENPAAEARDEAQAELAGLREELDDLRERLSGTEAAFKDHDEWLGEALDALGAKDVFAIKKAGAKRERAEARLSWLESDQAVERVVQALNEQRFSSSHMQTAKAIRDALLDEALAALRSGRETSGSSDARAS